MKNDNITQSIENLILQVLEKHTPKDDFPELISVKETVELMKGKISESTLYDLARNRKENGFPAVKLSSGIVQIHKQRLIRWLDEGGLFAIEGDE